MKTLLIFLSISYVRGDKLNNLYLPPIGANGSGGLSEDIDLPFEVPVQRYFGTDKISFNLLTEPDQNKSSYGIGHSTHAPSVPSIIHLDDKSKIFVSGESAASKDNFSTPIDINEDYNPNLLFDYNNEKFIPIADDKKDIAYINLAAEIPKPSNSIKELSNYKSNRISPDIRPQTEADRNAIVLNNKNVITPEGFSYSYDTSNGIHADESGTATDGVKAHGSYSYIGDDGKLYNVTYTADENGFRPKGDHLPTPPPIPEAILKVIEQAAIDRSNGIFDDGSYDENKYGYKKYENQNPKLNNLISFTRRFNGESNKPKNNEYANIVNSGVEIYTQTSTSAPSYAADGENDNFNKEQELNDQETDDYQNKETAYFNKLSYNADNRKESELENVTNRDFYTSAFPNIREENRLGYEYLSPKNEFVYRNKIIIPESYNDFGNKSSPTYVYDKSYTPESDINQTPFLTKPPSTTYNLDLNKNKDFINLAPNTVTDDEFTSKENPNIDQFGQNPSRPPSGPFQPYISPTLTPFYLPQGSTKAPEVAYEVSEGIMPIETYNDLQSNLDGPSSTERIKQLDANTNLPSYLYGPSSSGIMNLPGTYTDRPRYFYGLPTTDRIKEVETYTNRTNKINGHSSTEIINPIGTHDDQLSDLYDNFSTERINSIDPYNGRISDEYGPLSNERIKPIETSTNGPNEFYSPSSTERSFGENFAGLK